jgi:hypothetical protein
MPFGTDDWAGRHGQPIMSVRLPRLALPVAIAAAGATAATHLLDFSLFDLKSAALDAGANWSVSDTVSVVAIAIATVAVTSFAISTRRLKWFLLSAFLAFITIDDAIQVHGRIGDAWELAIVLPAAALLLGFSYSCDPLVGRLIRLGIAGLGCSFVLGITDDLVDLAGWGPTDWQFQLKVTVKQAAEIAGWILIAFGAVLVARVRVATSRQHLSSRPNARRVP